MRKNSAILLKKMGRIDNLDTPYLFDVSIFDKLNTPSLEEHINRVGQVFYKKTLKK